MTRSPLFAALPNLITLSRILLVPVTILMIADHEWDWALALFLLAGASDGLDGFLARTFDLRSELGAYLDALADKALLISIYITLAVVGAVPAAIALVASLYVARPISSTCPIGRSQRSPPISFLSFCWKSPCSCR